MRNEHGDFIWYELMTTDVAGAEAFYGDLVGWSFGDPGKGGIDYRMFSAGGVGIGGVLGLTREMRDAGARALWAGYIGVDDVDESVEAITAAGGGLLMPPKDIADVGRVAFVKAPDGAGFYVMRVATDAPSESFASHAPRAGHCAWNELNTEDPDGARSFYGDVFGWVVAETMDMGPAGSYEMLKNGRDRDFMFGGLMKKPDEIPVSLWSYYFRVPNIDAAVRYVKSHGGQVVAGPILTPGSDFAITGVDPLGACFGVVGKKCPARRPARDFYFASGPARPRHRARMAAPGPASIRAYANPDRARSRRSIAAADDPASSEIRRRRRRPSPGACITAKSPRPAAGVDASRHARKRKPADPPIRLHNLRVRPDRAGCPGARKGYRGMPTKGR
ncbi:MAG: VOC family protein [Pseudomonadota bacterium]